MYKIKLNHNQLYHLLYFINQKIRDKSVKSYINTLETLELCILTQLKNKLEKYCNKIVDSEYFGVKKRLTNTYLFTQAEAISLSIQSVDDDCEDYSFVTIAIVQSTFHKLLSQNINKQLV